MFETFSPRAKTLNGYENLTLVQTIAAYQPQHYNDTSLSSRFACVQSLPDVRFYFSKKKLHEQKLIIEMVSCGKSILLYVEFAS